MNNNTPSSKTLSVVVVPVVGKESLSQCLIALSRQTQSPMEVLVPYDIRMKEVSDLKTEYPVVEFLKFPGKGTYAELRAHAVRYSQGGIIVITEDHCLPETTWCENIVDSHADSHVAVGGVVDKKPPDSALNWAVYFADYVRYARPLHAGAVTSLTDLNVSYKREALEEISEVWSKEFHENAVHAALVERGHQLWLSPEIAVYQRRSFSLRNAVTDRYAFGRLFASTRVHWLSPVKRALLVLSSLMIPLLLTFRVSSNVFQKRRWMKEFFLSLPALLLINIVWAAGEFTGYLTGKSGTLPATESGLDPVAGSIQT